MQRVADHLTKALANEPVVVTKHDDTVKLTSDADFLYPPGGWHLSAGAPALSKMVPTLQPLQHTGITVDGFTDSTPVGPRLQRMGIRNNYDLSIKRANEAVNYFTAQGVKSDLLSARGFGANNPVAPNDTVAGRARNRRIEITLSGDGT